MPGDGVAWDVAAFTAVFSSLVLAAGGTAVLLLAIVAWARVAVASSGEGGGPGDG